MKTIRYLLTLVAVSGLCASLSAQTAQSSQAAPKVKAAKAQEPITLEFGNMKSEKPKLLSLARYLIDNSGRKDTAGYVGQYHEMVQMVTQLGIGNFAADEAKLIRSVPEPTAEAIQSYKNEKSKATQSVNQRISESDAGAARQQQERKLREAQQAQQTAAATFDITTNVRPTQSDAITTQAQGQIQQPGNLQPSSVSQTPADARLEESSAPIN